MVKNATRKKKNQTMGGGKRKMNPMAGGEYIKMNQTMGGGKRKMNPMGGGAKTPAVGTKAQVWHGKAKHTSGGLTRKDLMKTKKGRIVSRKKHAAGKKALKRLTKAGYKAKKGTFKLFKK